MCIRDRISKYQSQLLVPSEFMSSYVGAPGARPFEVKIIIGFAARARNYWSRHPQAALGWIDEFIEDVRRKCDVRRLLEEIQWPIIEALLWTLHPERPVSYTHLTL